MSDKNPPSSSDSPPQQVFVKCTICFVWVQNPCMITQPNFADLGGNCPNGIFFGNYGK